MCFGHTHLFLVAVQFHIDESDLRHYVESAQERQVGFNEVETQLLVIDYQNKSYGSLCENYAPVSCMKETAAFYTVASL